MLAPQQQALLPDTLDFTGSKNPKHSSPNDRAVVGSVLWDFSRSVAQLTSRIGMEDKEQEATQAQKVVGKQRA